MFLDFHMLVNSVAGETAEDGEETFLAVVAEAPVSRWYARFHRLAGGERLERLFGRYRGVGLGRDPGGTFHLRSTSSDESDDGQESDRDVIRPGEEAALDWDLEEMMFSILFPETSHAYDLLGKSCQRANLEHKSLRLKLELHPKLSNLPWEVIRCPLSFSWASEINHKKLTVLRYLGNISHGGVGAWRPQRGRKPCILIVKADPKEHTSGELASSFFQERDRVEKTLRRHGDWVDCELIEGPSTLTRLSRRVQELELNRRPVIGLHYIGHGGVGEKGPYLAGEDDQQHEHRIYERQLRGALDRAKSLRWVIFNACSTGVEPIGCPLAGLATSMAVIKQVPTVIAYKRPVRTSDAENLASEFYKLVLDQGLEVEDAVGDLQNLYDNPGGLVVLAQAFEGRVVTTLGIEDRERPPRPEEREEPEVETLQPETLPPWPETPAAAPPPDALGEAVLVPAGPFPKGLTNPQIDLLIRQFREHRLALELSSIREVLKQEAREEIEVPAFEIDLTPVTNAQFRAFVEATSYVTLAERSAAPQNWRINAQPDKRDHPVVFISYQDAQEYCHWAGKALPTADQWKKAYRGTEGNIYPWGDTFDVNRCNTAESQQGWQTTPVRRFPKGRSPYGCYDMVGNVEEWTSTSEEGELKVVLGGSWCMTCQVYGLPVLQRLARPSFYSNELGFRCVKRPE